MAELKFEITEHIGIVGENARGWSRELNMVSWNDREPKYDLRDWSPDHTKMGKGLTMTADELVALKEILDELGLDDFGDDMMEE